MSFVVASMLILLTPGPTNTLLASCGAAMGFRAAAFLTLAEAIGYAVAISLFAYFAAHVGGNAAAIAAIRIAAAAWLSYSAYRLWKTPFAIGGAAARDGFLRVLGTTLLNPKAMLVGTVLIPTGAEDIGVWVGAYSLLSCIAGLGWVLLGALLPLGIRRHAYKLAAVVLGGFSVAAVASTLG